MLTEPSIGSVCNVFDHMWGYFKKCADEEGRQQSRLFRADFTNGKIGTQTLLGFLAKLASKYDAQYLLQSRVLNIKKKK